MTKQPNGFDQDDKLFAPGGVLHGRLRDRFPEYLDAAVEASLAGKPASIPAAEWLLMSEPVRVAAILSHASPVAEAGAAPVAPALGATILVSEYHQAGQSRRLVSKHLERADVFDVMMAQARRRHGDSAAPFVASFSWSQIYMGRHYRDLSERYQGGGMKCSSLEASREGGEGGGFMDAYLADGEELKRLHRRIGPGEALVVRRIRPSKRGTKAGITDRRLVDMVCLQGKALAEVLIAHGWSNDGKHRDALRTALCGALDRMVGYREG